MPTSKWKKAFVPLLLALGLLASCSPSPRTFRIAVATFSHETCTFCPGETTMEDWEAYGPPTADILGADRGYIGGFKNMCREFGNVELIGITSPRGVAGGSSKSWNTREAFDRYTGLMAADLEKAGRLDGVFLALHGAMAVQEIPKPEAEIVRRIRAVVGNIPIMVTLDLHANEDRELSDAADAVFIVKRYPHYDTTKQGERAARVMIKTLKGRYRPTMATRKPGIITPSVFQGTGTSPAMEIMERARRWECRYNDVYVSVAFGFAYADVPDAGATVMVVTNDDQELADRIADDMSGFIWRMRREFAGKKLPGVKEGISLVLEAVRQGRTPVVIADHSDRTGGSTHILRELIRRGAKNFCIATLRDEHAVAEISKNHKVGDFVSILVGGHSDRFAGEPVSIQGTVSFIGTYRRDGTVVVRFGENNAVILTEHLMQVTDTDIYGKVGIDFEALDIVSLKSRVHFRRGYCETGIAGAVYEIDAPGLGPADLTLLPYKNIPRDLYPVYRKD